MTSDSKRPPKGRSGEHPVVVAFREKMDSIQEHTVPATEALLAQVQALKAKTDPPPAEDDDADPSPEGTEEP